MTIYNFTGVQASGVIIVYCDSAVSYGPKLKNHTLIRQLQRLTVKNEKLAVKFGRLL